MSENTNTDKRYLGEDGLKQLIEQIKLYDAATLAYTGSLPEGVNVNSVVDYVNVVRDELNEKPANQIIINDKTEMPINDSLNFKGGDGISISASAQGKNADYDITISNSGVRSVVADGDNNGVIVVNTNGTNEYITVYTHPSITDQVDPSVEHFLYKINVDGKGHVIGRQDITSEDILNLGIADSSLSTESTSPVQNQAVTNWLAENVKQYQIAFSGTGINTGAYLVSSDSVLPAAAAPDSGDGSSNVVYALEDYWIGTDWDYVQNKPNASSSINGLMSADDKAKLDGIEEDATKTIIELSIVEDSENPVQGGAIYSALSNKVDIDKFDELVSDKVDAHIDNKDNPHNVTTEQIGALPLDGSGTMTGVLYTSASTPLFIGKNGKVGMRAQSESVDVNNVGQINISNAWWNTGNQWGTQMSGYNGETGKYNQLRVSHEGIQYIGEDDVAHQVLHDGNVDAYALTETNPVGTGSLSLNRKVGTTVGYCSVAEGCNNTASGRAAHAEGEGTTATSQSAHAEGYNTTASAYYGHAEGNTTTASNRAAHAEGGYTVASGQQSHAEGFQTIAASTSQHVQGKYNIEDANDEYAHIVGNGTSSARANAHTLDWNGNAWYQGTIKVGGTSYDDAQEVLTHNNITTSITSGGTGLPTSGAIYAYVNDEIYAYINNVFLTGSW